MKQNDSNDLSSEVESRADGNKVRLSRIILRELTG